MSTAAPSRLVIHGASGSGTTTLAAELSAVRGVPHIELDAIFHQEGWTPLDRASFEEVACEIAALDTWVVDGNYSQVRPIFWSCAQVIVIVDLPRWRSTSRVLARSLRRGVMRTQLWNSNTERLSNLLRLDPERNVVRWSWQTHHRYHDEVPAAAAEVPGASVVVLTSPRQVSRFVEELAQTL